MVDACGLKPHLLGYRFKSDYEYFLKYSIKFIKKH